MGVRVNSNVERSVFFILIGYNSGYLGKIGNIKKWYILIYINK